MQIDPSPIGKPARGLRAFFAGIFSPSAPAHERFEPVLELDSAPSPRPAKPTRKPRARKGNGSPDLVGIDPAAVRDPRLAVLPVHEHASRLFAILQDEKPHGALIDAREVIERYSEMTLEQQIATRSWIPIARELRKLCGGRKDYRSERRNRIRVYRIPPRAGQHRQLKAA